MFRLVTVLSTAVFLCILHPEETGLDKQEEWQVSYIFFLYSPQKNLFLFLFRYVCTYIYYLVYGDCYKFLSLLIFINYTTGRSECWQMLGVCVNALVEHFILHTYISNLKTHKDPPVSCKAPVLLTSCGYQRQIKENWKEKNWKKRHDDFGNIFRQLDLNTLSYSNVWT